MRARIALLLAIAALPAWSVSPPSGALETQFVTVDSGVELEVVDWGGSGRPVILLAGLGNNAHVFDRFAPKLAQWYHVYGVTRRGFGASSAPATGYSADRLGKDVLAVMDTLKIDRPVLIGHSLAGEELSYIGSQDPKKVAGLIYLDAGYGYAFYDPSKDLDVQSVPPGIDLDIDVDELQRKLTQILSTGDIHTRIALFNELVATDLVLVRQDLQAQKRDLQAADAQLPPAQLPATPVVQAILAGMYRFTTVSSPILAIYADPHAGLPVAENTPSDIARAEAQNKASVEAQIAVLQRYNPSAQILRLPYASHYVFISNERAVLSAIHAFIQALPPPKR